MIFTFDSSQVGAPVLSGSAGALRAVIKACLVDGFGAGPVASITVAAGAEPVPPSDDVFQDEHGIPLGTQVQVSAESFGLEPTDGELIAATRTRYTVRRTDPRAGTVQVHFPRIGYALKAVVPAA